MMRKAILILATALTAAILMAAALALTMLHGAVEVDCHEDKTTWFDALDRTAVDPDRMRSSP